MRPIALRGRSGTLLDDSRSQGAADVLGVLQAFLETNVLKGSGSIEPATPLLEWGLLDSLSIMQLVAHIDATFGVLVTDTELVEENFRNLSAICLLVQRLGGSGSGDSADDVAGVPPRADAASAPSKSAVHRLSLQQEEMMRHIRRFPESADRHDYVEVYRIAGDLDVENLLEAIVALERRHAALRTVIEAEPPADRQRVLEVAPPVAVTRSARNVDELVSELLRRRLRTVADLSGEFLFRTQLDLLDGFSLLSFRIHHLICDLWSERLIRRDLAEFYAARRQRRTPRLPEVGMTYPDFALTQRADRDRACDAAFPYWRSLVEGWPGGIAWSERTSVDAPRDSEALKESTATALAEFSFPPDVTTIVQRVARAVPATPFTVLLAASAQSVARITGHDDLLVATDTSGRTRLGSHETVGFFVDTLLSRVRKARSTALLQIARTVRDDWIAAERHGTVPFSEIARVLGSSPLLDSTNLLRIDMHSAGAPDVPLELLGARVSPVPVSRAIHGNHDLGIGWLIRDRSYVMYARYLPERVHGDLIARLPVEVERILREAVRD